MHYFSRKSDDDTLLVEGVIHNNLYGLTGIIHQVYPLQQNIDLFHLSLGGIPVRVYSCLKVLL